MAKKKKPHLTAKKIQKGTDKGIRKYKKLNFFEKFAMYIGVAQLIEIILKQLLDEKFGFNIETTEKWTLGHVSAELKKNGLREDFIRLLEPVVIDRNYIAHDLLASDLIFNAMLKSKKKVYKKERRRLERAIYELEQLFFLLQWSNENNAWD